jgi:hypothetical protein
VATVTSWSDASVCACSRGCSASVCSVTTLLPAPHPPAPGPSRLIQSLLSRLLNPGEVEWLSLLNSRETLVDQHPAFKVRAPLLYTTCL